MRIGITNLFRGSAFGGGLPQVATYLGVCLKDLGHDVEFVLPEDSLDWFTDCLDVGKRIPVVKLVNGAKIQTYELLIEVAWFMPPKMRAGISQRNVMFYHYPAVFYDIESSTYPLSSQTREFTGLTAIWTWSHFKKTDYEYLEFISGCPVFGLPFTWNPMFLESYRRESSCPEWSQGETVLTICESNESNTSNCTLPMTVLSEICKTERTLRWRVLNSETLITRPFFVSNVVKNLHFGEDISGNFLKRVRLPDLCRESSVILSHQRWRPIKYMLLDALYLGIPLIHNCDMVKECVGGDWHYTMNRIGQALRCWDRIRSEPRPSLDRVRSDLMRRWGPAVAAAAMPELLLKTLTYVKPPPTVVVRLRIAFLDMWADFKPNYNAFTGLLESLGFTYEVNQTDPTLILFGPFGSDNTAARFQHVPKIFYTGENLPPVERSDVVLNVGFRRDVRDKYLRLPNWMTELNWFSQDPKLVVNPQPQPLESLNPVVTKGRTKFCAFVASNPNSVQRNSLYHTVSRYKKIDSAGSVFPNMDKLPCGPGGAGGQSSKIEFYKDYKFVLTCENSSTPGYVTEKLLHAKMAGCVPIYWGDPLVAQEFNPKSFINASAFDSAEDLLARIKQLDENEDEWLSVAAEPVLSETRIQECRSIWTTLAEVMVKSVGSLPTVPAVAAALPAAVKPLQLPPYKADYLGDVGGKAIVTCCNVKFIDSVLLLIHGSKVPVYVWTIGLTDVQKGVLEKGGAKKVTPLDTSWNPGWDDFWNMAHYAWKPLLLYLATNVFEKGTQILYLDAGVQPVGDLESVWYHITKNDIFVVHMPENKMKTWSHPKFCAAMNLTAAELELPQLSANIIGFKVGGQYQQLFKDVMTLACNPEVIAGHKWYSYSETCKGHRHDQSIYTVMCSRAGVKPNLLGEYVCHESYDDTEAGDKCFYVHRGGWKKSAKHGLTPELRGVDGVYIINLETREDRLQKFKNAHPGFATHVKRHVATYGRTLKMTPEIAHLFRNNDFKWKKSVIGCALSHYSLWKKLRDDAGAAAYLILEDDVVFEPGFVETWNRIVADMPADTSVVMLGGVLPPNKVALPMVTEPVNKSFARVKVHNLFGGELRRYFHFCAYSYILTKAGAQQLCSLIEQRGIFTSMDHMIVNHGDSLLKLYFTTPLLAGCFQDADPVYQKADFNNFNRVDKFDSEIWNNLECFSPEEVAMTDGLQIVYFEEGQPVACVETEWLQEIFGSRLVWKDAASTLTAGKPVLVLYQHTTPVRVIEGWLNRNMDCRLYLLHLSDERCLDDVTLYSHPAVRGVFRNYWRSDCVGPKVVHLPLGYHNGRGSSMMGRIEPSSERSTTWSFAGAMDRPERASLLDTLIKEVPNGIVHKTPSWHSSSNLGPAEYKSMLLKSKFVPCYNGIFNTESFRFYEAIEHGSIPIVPLSKSYTELFPDAPLLGLAEMAGAGHVMTTLSSRGPVLDKLQMDTSVWWTGYKKTLRATIQQMLEKTIL
jgi:alpha(1,3/1,4) fucosyltransferase